MLPSTHLAPRALEVDPAAALALPSRGPTSPVRDPIVGSSPAIHLAVERACLAARSDADILLEAESGTGKELLARLVHEKSSRKHRPFVAINCAALPDNLLESELFGHARGAFTGAVGTSMGKIALASGGTLLLDEIGEMPLPLQPKLLRVLQEREFYRLGDSRPIRVDVRIIASTNRCLHALVEEGRFREDLYYRLNVIPLTLPPLRDRGEDVIELAEYFAAKFAMPNPPLPLSRPFCRALREYAWPGNVRELANTMRRAVALCEDGEIGADLLLPAAMPQQSRYMRPGLSLRELEKKLIQLTLEATAGNRTHAAALLGISLRTVRNKIREHGLSLRRLP